MCVILSCKKTSERRGFENEKWNYLEDGWTIEGDQYTRGQGVFNGTHQNRR